MVCGEIRLRLLEADGSAPAELAAHLKDCLPCTRVAAALQRLDDALRSTLLAAPALSLQARLASLADESASPSTAQAAPAWHLQTARPSLADESASRPTAQAGSPRHLQPTRASLAGSPLAASLRDALVVEPPIGLRARLVAAIAAEEPRAMAVAQLNRAFDSALVVAPPAALRSRLLGLVPATDGLAWLPSLWHMVRARPGVFAGQLAALAVLAYAILQVAAWLGSLPLVLGDIPYALELLVMSPAVDALGQFQGVLQQLALWLVLGAAAWLLAQGLSGRGREPVA